MSESKSELVSSLVDNYCVDYQQNDALINELDQALDQLTDQASHASDTWERYHLIGDTLRNELPETLQLDLSAQIAAKIADEPSILAPSTPSIDTPSVNLTTGSNVTTLKSKVVQFIKPFGQLAIAASAAGLMILGVQNNVANNDTIMPSQVVQTVPLAGFADPVSFNYQTSNAAAKKQAYLIQQRRFQALLFDHQQQIKLNSTSEHAVYKQANNETDPLNTLPNNNAAKQVKDLPK